MKKVILSLAVISLFSSLHAEGLGSELISAGTKIAEKKIEADKQVAIANQAEVTIANSTLMAEGEVGKDSVMVGANGAIVMVGSDVEVETSTVIAEGTVGDDSVVVGANGAIIVGAH